MSRSQVLVILVVGAALGVAGAMLLPDAARRVLPASLVGTTPGVAGKVLDKERGGDRLLLTVETTEGVVLVTFKKRIPEIDLLVKLGDRVTLDLDSYEPFVEDPRIQRVQKPEQYDAALTSPPVSAPAAPPAGAARDTAASPTTGAAARDTAP